MDPNSTQTPPFQPVSLTPSPSSLPTPTTAPIAPAPPANPPVKEGTSKKRTIFAIFLLIFFYIIGVFFVWFFTKWPRWAKILTILPIFLVIGFILLSVIIIAVRPQGVTNQNKDTGSTVSKSNVNSSSISRANDAKRQSNIYEILNSVGRYSADNQGKLPVAIITSTQEIGSGPGKADLCKDFVPAYMSDFPVDPKVNAERITNCNTYSTGYTIVKNPNGTVTVSAPNTESVRAPISTTR